MVEVKLTKTFIDNNTGKDIYILSIKMGDKYHNIACDKEEFESLFYGIRSIFNNSLND
jgi:hypothetical protein